jgi:hypothetical protein
VELMGGSHENIYNQGSTEKKYPLNNNL